MCLHAIGETAQTGALLRVGATHAIVDDLDDDNAIAAADVDAHGRCSRVLADVGEALGDDLVGGYLDLLRQAAVEAHGQSHRRRRVCGD